MSKTEAEKQASVDAYLQKFHEYLKDQADTKVTKAMRLWLRCDNNYKMVVLHATGFDTRMLTCPCAAKHLREHFDTMDLIDELDSCIDDMESDIRNAAEATTPAPSPAPAAWHDAPTEPGLWMCNEGDDNPYRWTTHRVTFPLNQLLVGEDERWYGPIPQDGEKS